MSLDVYVMPLWRFKAGGVSTGLSRIFGERSAVAAFGRIFRLQEWIHRDAKAKAKADVKTLLDEVEAKAKVRPQWKDDGETVFAEQASYGFEALRAFAKWLDLRDSILSFEDPPERNFYNHPALKANVESGSLRFAHIVEHNCYSGYFLPCPFDRVFHVEPHEAWGRTFERSVGSSLKLAEQLSRLEPYVCSPDKPLAGMSEYSYGYVRAGFETLSKVARLSVRHQLPIIFWG